MIEHLLFGTRLGEWLLAQIERRLGLAVVKADELAERRIAEYARVIHAA